MAPTAVMEALPVHLYISRSVGKTFLWILFNGWVQILW